MRLYSSFTLLVPAIAILALLQGQLQAAATDPQDLTIRRVQHIRHHPGGGAPQNIEEHISRLQMQGIVKGGASKDDNAHFLRPKLVALKKALDENREVRKNQRQKASKLQDDFWQARLEKVFDNPHAIYASTPKLQRLCVESDKLESEMAKTQGSIDELARMRKIWRLLVTACHAAKLPPPQRPTKAAESGTRRKGWSWSGLMSRIKRT